MEIWKAIPGFTGYEVSDEGRIRSYHRPYTEKLFDSAVVMDLNPDKDSGYVQVGLRKDDKTYNNRVHALVMAAFVGPRPADQPQIRHLDGNPANNKLENLKYGTAAENWEDSARHGTAVMYKGMPPLQSKLDREQVENIKIASSKGASTKLLAFIYGVSVIQVSLIARGLAWSSVRPDLSREQFFVAMDQPKLEKMTNLICSGLPISVVAEIVMYDISTVSRRFKSYNGISIREWRKQQ